MVGERRTQKRVVAGQRRFHVGRVVLPQHRRTLDVSEQERRPVG
jgi:hypothetical protein